MKFIPVLGAISSLVTPQAVDTMSIIQAQKQNDEEINIDLNWKAASTTGNKYVEFKSSWGIGNSGNATTQFTDTIDGYNLRKELLGYNAAFKNRDISISHIKLENSFKILNSPGSVDKAEISGLSIEIIKNNGKSFDPITQPSHGKAKDFFSNGQKNPYGRADVDVVDIKNSKNGELNIDDIAKIIIKGSISWVVKENSSSPFGDVTKVALENVKYQLSFKGLSLHNTHEKFIKPNDSMVFHQNEDISKNKKSIVISFMKNEKKDFEITEVIYEDDKTIIFKPIADIEVIYHKISQEFIVTNHTDSSIEILELTMKDK